MTTTTTNAPLFTADGTPLKASLQKALRQRRRQAFLLVLPLLAFIFVLFIVPIASMLSRSVGNPEVNSILPKTVLALQSWDEKSGELPSEEIFKTMALELLVAKEKGVNGKVGKRLNFELPGMSSLFRTTPRRIEAMHPGPYREKMTQIKFVGKYWADVATWQLIKRESDPTTASYYLSAVDMTFGADGSATMKPEDQRIYKFLFMRTFLMSIGITFMTILLGYPVAYLLATLPMRYAALLMILVLLPFWTSLLVRTSAWMVLLGNEGVINDLLVWTGLLNDDNRLALINNRTGTFVAMTHILLPFMILPLYSVMKTIPPSYMRAARSMGATQLRAHIKVYFPLTLTGIGAGTLLVFILAIGYYITPELVGGQSGTFISNEIARHFGESGNWGLASALGAILLVFVLVLYALYDRVIGIDKMKLG